MPKHYIALRDESGGARIEAGKTLLLLGCLLLAFGLCSGCVVIALMSMQ